MSPPRPTPQSAAPEPIDAGADAEADAAGWGETTYAEPATAVEAPPRDASDDESIAPGDDNDVEQGDAQEPSEDIVRPRRIPARMWRWLAIAAALLAIAAAALVYFAGSDDLRSRVGMAGASGSPLDLSGSATPELLPTNKQLLTVNGEIRNRSDAAQRVPQVRADVVDGDGRVIFSWSIAPPVRELAPGATVPFNSASTDVPRGGRTLRLDFSPLT